MSPSDTRLESGTGAMLRLREERIAAGERPIGWKVGFGAPAALEKFGLEGPLVGFLTDAGLVESGARVSLQGWRGPVAEAELAMRIGSDLEAAPTEDQVRSAIASLGPAIELADVHPPPEDVEMILRGNIFHRAVILGEADAGRAGADLEGLVGRVGRNGEQVAVVTEPEALTGRVVDVIGHLARTLWSHGEVIRIGDVVITGSIIPPLPLQPGDEVTFEVAPAPPLSVRLV